MDKTHIFSELNYAIAIQMPDGTSQEFLVLREAVSIGRAPDNDLVLNDPSISRRHARLIIQPQGVLIEDLGSSNGTFVGERRLMTHAPALIQVDQPIRLGNVVMGLRKPSPGKLQPARARPRSKLMIAGAAIGAVVLAVALCLGGIYGLGILRQRIKNATTFVCDQPAMALTSIDRRMLQATSQASGQPALPEPTATGVIPGAPPQAPGRPIQSLAFLELPFPYDGGNVNFGGTNEQFIKASHRNGQGGRINSFFDHYYPLYPCSKNPDIPGGQEPCEQPIGEKVLLYEGTISDNDSYSGHPGYDFSTFEFHKATTPVFAAADGVIYAVGEHSASGALFVEITHTVPGVGDFMTIYWHLEPDQYFQNMMGRERQHITAGTRIGTMGNTGYSTGHHLHFEVRFDANHDHKFPLSEVIDPYGYIPSPSIPVDPWYERTLFHSQYLWIHPMGAEAVVPQNGGGKIETPGGTGGAGGAPENTSVCAKAGTFPPGGTVYWSLSPGPKSTDQMANAGNGCVLSAFDDQGNPVNHFDHPVQITIPFEPADFKNFDQKTLSIYWLETGSHTWKSLDTTFDYDKKIAKALTEAPGRCALLGKPTVDILPPTTAIDISGPSTPEGDWYSTITITLRSSDPSGIKKVEYSLDHGTTWKAYTGPFTIQPQGTPTRAMMDEEFFGGLPGTFLILASATDGSANVENPPASRVVAINPTKKPVAVAQQVKPPANPTTTPTVVIPITHTIPLLQGFGQPKVGPNDFPAGFNPLTGEPCQDPALLQLSPALVSVTNFPPKARPQAGLSYAPVVSEMTIGEGMTRFLAMFYCNFPQVSALTRPDQAVIGPIRSGRLPYESLRKLYNGFLIMASGSAEVVPSLSESVNIFGSDESDINSALIDISRLQAIAEANSKGKDPPNLTGNLFDPNPPGGGQDASKLWVFYSFLNQIQWAYDAGKGVYLRSQDNADGSGAFTPSTDRLNGERLGFDNVVVLYAEHRVLNKERTLIDINLLYTGNVAYLFRDGMMYPIYWLTMNGDYERRTGRLRPIRFTDQNWQPFPLKPGNTWIEIVDINAALEEFEPGSWKVRFFAP